MYSKIKSTLLPMLVLLLALAASNASASTILMSGGGSCPSTGVGGASACADIKLTASGGTVQLNLGYTHPWTVSGANSGDFSLTGDTSTGSACGMGTSLSSGQSCYISVTFLPSAVGTRTASFALIAPALGTPSPSSLTLTATGATPTASIVLSNVSCPTTSVGGSVTCSGTAYIQANGSLTLAANPVALSGANSGDFAVAAGNCGGPLMFSGYCTLGAITFHPTGTGTRTATLTANVSSGGVAGSTGALSGTGTAGTASVSSLACPTTTAVGSSSTCSGTITLTASGGGLQLGSSVYTTSGSTTSFTVAAPGSNACTANQLLASGASCNLLTVSSFTPQSAGAASETITVTPAAGTAGSGTVTGTGATLTASPSSVSCGSTGVGTSVSCTGTVTVTASGASVTLNGTPTSLSDATDFVLSGSTCTASKVLTAGSTCTFGVTFAPQSAGAKSTTVTINSNFGSPAITASGTAVNGSLAASPTSLACGTLNAGSSGTCSSGSVTITASTGSVTLSSSPVSQSDSTDFTVPLGTCTANLTLAPGASCTLSTIRFNPASAGAKSNTVTLNTSAGTGTSFTLTGSATSYVTASGNSTCPSTVVGGSSTCTSVTLTATGGSVTFGATPLSNTDSTDFAVSGCANASLTAGQSCTVTASFTPGSTGAKSATITATPTSGNGVSFSVSGTPFGTTSASPTTLSCGSASVGASVTCGTGVITVTANGGAENFGASPFSNNDTTDFTVPAGSCANASLSAGQTCTSGTITFNPASSGAHSATVTVSPTGGSPTTFSLSGTGVLGTPTLSNTVSCPNTGAGTTAPCTGAVSLTATGGPLTLGATPVTSTDSTDFSVGSGTCTANLNLTSGQSCALGTITFKPQSIGSLTTSITVNTNNGNPSTTVNGTGIHGSLSASPASLTCPSTNVGASSSCGTVTLMANGGPVTLGASPLSNSDSTDFSVLAGSCANVTLTVGQTCMSGTLTFNPASAGTHSATVTVSPSAGGSTTFSLSGTGTLGTPTISNTVTCPNTGAGTTNPCTGSLTVTATGGPLTLGATPVTSTDSTDFSVGSGTCTANLNLASGQSCSLGTITFKPQSTGPLTTSITVNTNNGNPSTTVSGTGINGSLSASPASLTCPSANVGASSSCGTVTLTANGGPVTLGASPFSNSDSTDFSLLAGACANVTLTVGQTCTSGTLTFNPASAGTHSATVTVSPAAGGSTTFSLSGTGTLGTPTISNTVACPNTGAGTTSPCTGSLTVTATGGPLTLGATPITSSDATDFSVGSGTCTANLNLASGQSCSLGTITFTPQSTGVLSTSITVNTNNGNPSTTVSGTGINGSLSASPASLTCPATNVGASSSCGTVTLTANGGPVVLSSSPLATDDAADFSITSGTCLGSTTLASGQSCSASVTFAPTSAGAKSTTLTASTTSGTGASFSAAGSAYSYSWSTGDFGTCVDGGAGTWAYSGWAPTTGCGTNLTQTRTGTCVVNPNSSFQSRVVSCLRSDGLVVDNSACDSDTMPAATQSCTPSGGFSCGPEAPLSQTFSDTSTCSYSWNTGAWADCSGGSGSWVYTDWTPAIGSACTLNLNQTRGASCVGNTNSGVQSRTVSCLQSDGVVVDDSLCSGTKPEGTGSCTPTVVDCGAEGALSQTVADTSTCSYSWTAGGFGSCVGTGTWSYSEWAPATGCGATEQTRSNQSCDGSGTQTQTVTCTQSDGTTVDDANCDPNSKPASTQSCSLTAANCPTPLTSQTVTLTNACPPPNNGGNQGSGNSGATRSCAGASCASVNHGAGVTLPNCTPDQNGNQFCVVYPTTGH